MAGILPRTLVLLTALSGVAQSPNRQTIPPAQTAKPGSQAAGKPGSARLTPEQKFVMDAVEVAVALPVRDPQDRLRVLANAAQVVSTVSRAMAKNLWKEGVQVESEMIRAGQKPPLSMMATGQADCATALAFVENVPPEAAVDAEQSLIGAVTSCPKQTLDAVSRKLDAALEKRVVAPRALMAAMQAAGEKSAWSQSRFETIFQSLPDAEANAAEAESLAMLYSSAANSVEKSLAEKAGLSLLDWLAKTQDTPARARAFNITGDAMRRSLGEEGLKRALENDVGARAALQSASAHTTENPQPTTQPTTSALEAMRNNGSDQSERLRDLPPAERARDAAAHGFAAASAGDKAQAAKYFDMAFNAADDAWEARTGDNNAVAAVQEVGEAAAQVDSLSALQRAQKLRDPAEQAIAMLAVARVVAGNGLVVQNARSPR